jgi:hypothetical protein
VTFEKTTGVKLELSPSTKLLKCTDMGLEATELRLWKTSLSEQQLKTVSKQPLAILHERKQQLNIQIKKKTVEEKPKKKVGGLKFTSKFD